MSRPLGSVPLFGRAAGSPTVAALTVPTVAKAPLAKLNEAGQWLGPPLQRLVVGLGAFDQSKTGVAPGFIGKVVTQRLLLNSGVEESVIHRPGRHTMGGGYSRSIKDLTSGSDTRRVRLAWDRPAFADYGGLWCDRVLLGDAKRRTGVLEPEDIAGTGDSIFRALSRHKQLEPSHVLVVGTALDVAFGQVKLRQYGDEPPAMCRYGSNAVHDGFVQRFALQERPAAAGHGSAYWLGVGCGDIDVDEPFTADEWEAISDIVAPMAAFVAGLWADDPGQAMLYANRPKIAVSTEARAMWSTKQHAMAPYRDDALLASADSPHYGGARQRMIDGVMDRRIAKRADDAKRRARESSSKTIEDRGWKRRR